MYCLECDLLEYKREYICKVFGQELPIYLLKEDGCKLTEKEIEKLKTLKGEELWNFLVEIKIKYERKYKND